MTRIGWAALPALALAACSGPPEISLGVASVGPVAAAFLSPTGVDVGAGTRDRPWKTFEYAWQNLLPAATLTLLPGTYDHGTGYLDARCGENVRMELTGVTVRTLEEDERKADLHGDGSAPPIHLKNCQGWTIDGLRAESDDLETASTAPEAGSVVFLEGTNRDVVLRRLLLSRPNAYKHSHGLRIGDGARNVVVEECELYDFHHNGIEITRASAITLRRNYVNGRGVHDRPRGFSTDDPLGADYGVVLEETSDIIAENNVVEGVHDGFAILGRDERVQAPIPTTRAIQGNRLFGNVVREPVGFGIRLDSRCQYQNPCNAWQNKILETTLRDNVVIGGAAGVSSAGAITTSISRLSVLNAANGVLLIREPQNAGFQPTSTTVDSLVAGFQNVGFKQILESTWSWSHCAASGGLGPDYLFQPVGTNVVNPVSLAPDLGGCLVFLPRGSPLRMAGTEGPVGANIVDRYENGILQVGTPLWARDSGAFPCGKTAAPVNDVAGASCFDVYKRLNVAPPFAVASDKLCPLP